MMTMTVLFAGVGEAELEGAAGLAFTGSGRNL